MPGPLPDPNAQRRNKPTIPTTNLPAGGRKGAAPKCPHPLAAAGGSWWKWAWKTPQAAGWSKGDLYLVARRAQLEDDMATISEVESLDFGDLVETEKLAEVRRVVGMLAALVGGRLAIVREMREIDDRLGLTPKGMAALRWKIVDDEEGKAPVRTLRSVPTAPAGEDPRRLLG